MVRFAPLMGVILAGLAIASCSNKNVSQIIVEPTDPYYTSAYPHTDVSEQLERIQESTVRIISTGIYTSYRLEEENKTMGGLEGTNFDSLAASKSTVEESAAGTAFVMDRNLTRALLMTSAHVVDYPDTIFTFRRGEDIPEETFVQSILVKKNQTNFTQTPNGLQSFDIVDTDIRSDLALLRVSMINRSFDDYKPINIPMGNSKNLRTGSMVYVLGYPRGYEMASRGIVGRANIDSNGDFVTDALFNPGISGGVVLASKDNFNSFEWVGVSNAAHATRSFVLVPDMRYINPEENVQPYQGLVQAERQTDLSYGVTHAVPTQMVARFLDPHKNDLRRSFRRAIENQ